MERTPTQIVSEMGSRLLQLSRPNKSSLVKSLREAATTLSQIEQPSVTEVVNNRKALKLLEAELRPLKKSIIKHDLLKNRDNDVSLLVTVCVSEIFRILAPEPPFEDKYLRIAFDNGNVELVCLDSEGWETLSHESLGQQEVLGKETESFGSRNFVPEITRAQPAKSNNAQKQKKYNKAAEQTVAC